MQARQTRSTGHLSEPKKHERTASQTNSNLLKQTGNKSKSRSSLSFDEIEQGEDDRNSVFSLKNCNHERVKGGECVKCKTQVPQYGSVFDTGTVKTFIKVLYVDESKRQQQQPSKQQVQQASEVAVRDESEEAQGPVPREFHLRCAVPQKLVEPLPSFKVIFESYSPTDTHLMREYMLVVIVKNIRRMLKHRLISAETFKQFELASLTSAPSGQSEELCSYLASQKRSRRGADPEYLQFDSMLESGNLERVEVQHLSQKYIEYCKANKQPMVQKYNLYCKVDTNTKGHQQWFYFKVKNPRKDTRYQFSICNFTKPFSLFKQGMQIQLLSKRHQREYVAALEAELVSERSEISADARLLKERGVVREQWQAAGSKIEYTKSKLERGGWNVPGPLNIDDEEEANVDQDDLNIKLIDDRDSSPHEEQKNWQEPQGNGNPLYQTDVQSPTLAYRKRYFYQMNFEIEFPYAEDTVYLAYSQPYPYSRVIAHMFEVEQQITKLPQSRLEAQNDEQKSARGIFRRKITRKAVVYDRSLLCRTICGLPVPKITITANSAKLGTQLSLQPSKRKTIFVTARVHPGETNASTVYEGFLNQLVDQVETSPILANYILRLIPCMNPDGVVCGNYRSSLAGVDLNRQWIIPNRQLHPEVFHTKALMNQITNVENKKILIYCDIHCHSKKKNSFLYGCNTAAEGAPFSTWTQVRLLPRLLAKRSEYISLSSCRFGIDACKLGTARVVVWKEFKVMNSFTLENSFYGYDYGPEMRVYTQTHYLEIGANLAQSFDDYRVCLEQIREEMLQSKGWLKPIKLKEITGTPAADVIAQELRQDKLKRKKEDYIRKYHSRMAKESLVKGFAFNKAGSFVADNPVGEQLPRPSKEMRRSVKELAPLVSKLQGQANPKERTTSNTGRQRQEKASEASAAPEMALLNNSPLNKVPNTALNKVREVASFNEKRVTLARSVETERVESEMLVAENQSQMHELRDQVSSILAHKNDQEFFQCLQDQHPSQAQQFRKDSSPSREARGDYDWRQLFDQDELNRAYQQSILAFNPEDNQQAPAVKADSKKEKTLPSVRAGQTQSFSGAPTTEQISEDDESDDDASKDNLQEVDLYSKVYLQENAAIERQMRQTSTAQKNFIKEVKILINKKDLTNLEIPIQHKVVLPVKTKREEDSQQLRKAQEKVTIINSQKNSFAGEPLLLQGVTIENPALKVLVLNKGVSVSIKNTAKDQIAERLSGQNFHKVSKLKVDYGPPVRKSVENRDGLQIANDYSSKKKPKPVSKLHVRKAGHAIQRTQKSRQESSALLASNDEVNFDNQLSEVQMQVDHSQIVIKSSREASEERFDKQKAFIIGQEELNSNNISRLHRQSFALNSGQDPVFPESSRSHILSQQNLMQNPIVESMGLPKSMKVDAAGKAYGCKVLYENKKDSNLKQSGFARRLNRVGVFTGEKQTELDRLLVSFSQNDKKFAASKPRPQATKMETNFSLAAMLKHNYPRPQLPTFDSARGLVGTSMLPSDRKVPQRSKPVLIEKVAVTNSCYQPKQSYTDEPQVAGGDSVYVVSPTSKIPSIKALNGKEHSRRIFGHQRVNPHPTLEEIGPSTTSNHSKTQFGQTLNHPHFSDHFNTEQQLLGQQDCKAVESFQQLNREESSQDFADSQLKFILDMQSSNFKSRYFDDDVGSDQVKHFVTRKTSKASDRLKKDASPQGETESSHQVAISKVTIKAHESKSKDTIGSIQNAEVVYSSPPAQRAKQQLRTLNHRTERRPHMESKHKSVHRQTKLNSIKEPRKNPQVYGETDASLQGTQNGGIPVQVEALVFEKSRQNMSVPTLTLEADDDYKLQQLQKENGLSNKLKAQRRSESFQQYIQMSLPLLKNEALKESYKVQLQQNQEKIKFYQNMAAQKTDGLTVRSAHLAGNDTNPVSEALPFQLRKASEYQQLNSKPVQGDLSQEALTSHRRQIMLGQSPRVQSQYCEQVRAPNSSLNDASEVQLLKAGIISLAERKELEAISFSFEKSRQNGGLNHSNTLNNSSLPIIARTTVESVVNKNSDQYQNSLKISRRQSVLTDDHSSMSPPQISQNRSLVHVGAASLSNNVTARISPVRQKVAQIKIGRVDFESLRVGKPLFSSMDSQEGQRLKLKQLLGTELPVTSQQPANMLLNQFQIAKVGKRFKHGVVKAILQNGSNQSYQQPSQDKLPLLSSQSNVRNSMQESPSVEQVATPQQGELISLRDSKNTFKKNYLHLNAQKKLQSLDSSPMKKSLKLMLMGKPSKQF